MLWLRATAKCFSYVLRLRAMATCYGYVLWIRATATCYGYVLRIRVTATSYGYVLRLRDMATCYSYVLWLMTPLQMCLLIPLNGLRLSMKGFFNPLIKHGMRCLLGVIIFVIRVNRRCQCSGRRGALPHAAERAR